MKITPDDPRLTAYALDELAGAEREAIETELETSDECRREVEEIARAAALLSAELAAEQLPELTYAQQLAIESKLKPDSDKTAPRRHFPIDVLLKGRNPICRALVFAAGAAVLVGIWLVLSSFFTGGPGTTAFAQTLEQIQKAKFIIWTSTVYMHESSEDGQMTWVKAFTKQCAYKAPGWYRETGLDEDGQLRAVRIQDTAQLRQLTLLPEQKIATLAEVKIPMGEREGPFASVMKELKGDDLQFVETRNMPTGEVNVFRYSIPAKKNPNGVDWSYDYWIDNKTKQLVELRIPGTDIYDPDKDPTRNNPPGTMSRGRVAGAVFSGFVFDAELEESLFRLDPPAGYTAKGETISRLYVTEKQMIDFLGILADYNDQVFPERKELAGAFSDGRVRKTMEKPKKDRTATEQKFWETLGLYIEANLNDPIGEFLYHSTVENSFRYLGKGAKLGDKDRIVCWYRLKGAATYRVVYGDLSVRDIAAEDLPLPVEP